MSKTTPESYFDDGAEIESIIGPPGSPIPRLTRVQRNKVRVWLAKESGSGSVSSELLVRAALVAGHRLQHSLLESSILSSSFQMNDLSKYAGRLSILETTLDSSAVLRGIEGSISGAQSPLSMKAARSVCTNLQKWKRWVSAKRAVLSNETVVALLQLSAVVMKRLAKPKRKGSRVQERIETLAVFLMSLSLPSPIELSKPSVLLSTLHLFRAARTLVGEDQFEDLLRDPLKREWLDEIGMALPRALEVLATEGRADELTESVALSAALPGVEGRVRSVADNLWSTKAGVLPENVQRWLQDFLGISERRTVGAVELVDTSERPEIPQLGLALLRAWDARNEGRGSIQAFETLHQVCRNFFGIRLSGEVGSTIRYDPRFHELEGEIKGAQNVILRRPWIEWREGEKWKVVIRGLVNPS